MRRRKNHWKRVTLGLAAALLLTALPARVRAEAEYAEWWNFRNTLTNNAVTARPTPTSDSEAWGKWAQRYTNENGTVGTPTPPVIVNGKLYIGLGNRIAEINKESGEVLRWSETMPGNVGYAMQSPVYVDGRIFIAITNGRICAINVSDMTLAWTTDNTDIIRGQTVSPLNYVEVDGTGYISTGTWTTAGGDLICATTDDSDVTVDASGKRIKALAWTFNAAEADAENLAANDSVALGYYWTGAYVTEKYLAIGSDNGSQMGTQIDDTAFYTLDPQTGAIIDAVYGIHGQVRSTAVYSGGSLYFSTKDAKVYKIPVDEGGQMGEPSYIDMGSFGAKMATATPIVYGGRIYLGVQGQGGQFSADGGHGFVVAADDERLSQDSFVYRIPVPGYPQAGALLSTYHEDEDYNGDGEADGRVYLFFTYNALPGGIYYTYDVPGQTEPTTLSTEEAKIFVPASGMQQYCISSIVVDEEGTLYYKNDSNYLFAVESNPATLQNLTVRDEGGNELLLDKTFLPKMADYGCVVGADNAKVRVELDLPEGVSATVAGQAYAPGGVEVATESDSTEIAILTDKAGKRRNYSLTVRKAGANADLASLASSMSNTVPDISTEEPRRLDPNFDKDVTEYGVDWIATGTGDGTDPATYTMMNLFLKPDSEKATVRVWAVENVDASEARLDSDGSGSLRRHSVANAHLYKYSLRVPVYAEDIRYDSRVRIEVTAEDGKTTKEYFVTFNRRIYVADVTLDSSKEELLCEEELQLSATVLPENATDPTLVWSSSDARVATVDENGLVTAHAPGTAEITAASEDGPMASCEVKVNAPPKKTGWQKFDGEWYFIDDNGEALTSCWKKDSADDWYWLGADGKIAKNLWAKDSMGWLWMGPDGKITGSGWKRIEGEWYYLKSGGYRMENAWKKDATDWYWLGADGKIAKNVWAKDSTGWCWMGADGKIAKNKWIQYNKEWYYLKSNGYMAAGEWARDSKGWMWMNGDGRIAKAKWQWYNGNWYYLKDNGYMAASESLTVGGRKYSFDASGRMK